MEGGQIGKETEFVFEDDELDSGQTNNAGGQNKHKLHVSNKGKCMFLVGNGTNIQTFFANCFESIMVEQSYFHLEHSMKYKTLSKKLKLKEESQAEQDLM